MTVCFYTSVSDRGRAESEETGMTGLPVHWKLVTWGWSKTQRSRVCVCVCVCVCACMYARFRRSGINEMLLHFKRTFWDKYSI